MVTKVFGEANGFEVIFTYKEGNRWEITVPSNLEGEYVVEIFAEDEAGNTSYVCAMLFIICGHEIQVKVLDGGYTGEINIGTFLSGVQGGGFTVERKVCK